MCELRTKEQQKVKGGERARNNLRRLQAIHEEEFFHAYQILFRGSPAVLVPAGEW